MTMLFTARLAARIAFTLHEREPNGRRRTAHTCHARDPIATVRNNGCNRSSQNKHPALMSETNPSPARTCGSIHQLGVRSAATIDNMPALRGSIRICAQNISGHENVSTALAMPSRGRPRCPAQLSSISLCAGSIAIPEAV